MLVNKFAVMSDNKSKLKQKQNIKEQFLHFKKESKFAEIANLISYAFQNNSGNLGKEIFGYVPRIFREIVISKNPRELDEQDLFIGEPVIYKIYFPDSTTFCNIPFFYIFCHIKENSHKLDVYFQAAHPKSKLLDQEEYNIHSSEIGFEGLGYVFDGSDISTICISDPGHFIPGLTTSFYLGTSEINFPEIISQMIENIARLAKIKLSYTFLFGSSAGSMGALMSSTYLSEKANVMAVNSQITLENRNKLLETLFKISDHQKILELFGSRISCHLRFREITNLSNVPNIYILANVNDGLYKRNYNFYDFYHRRFSRKGVNNQSVFDSYYGFEGHGRPNKVALKSKIKIARESLMMEHNDS